MEWILRCKTFRLSCVYFEKKKYKKNNWGNNNTAIKDINMWCIGW